MEEYKVDEKKLSNLLYQSYMMFVLQGILSACIIIEIYELQEDFKPKSSSVELYFCKFVTSIAMHLEIY